MQSYWQYSVIVNRKCPYLSDFWKHEKVSFVEQVSQERKKKEKRKERKNLISNTKSSMNMIITFQLTKKPHELQSM